MSEHLITRERMIKKKVKDTVRIELMYCPFCGGEAEFRGSKTCTRWATYGIRCKDCGALTAMRGGFNAHERAAELWNRRAEVV